MGTWFRGMFAHRRRTAGVPAPPSETPKATPKETPKSEDPHVKNDLEYAESVKIAHEVIAELVRQGGGAHLPEATLRRWGDHRW